ncbi:hypothetical protein BUE80_DR001059 [Diplocarpon rosae]|nr:hypothetical protein BUE80_DR001059 [Diplocarpon rosae]
MTAPRTASQEPRLGNTAAPSSAHDAALQGASLAYGKPPVKPKPQSKTYSGNNGALAAASLAGGGGSWHNQKQNQNQNVRNITASRLEELGGDQKLARQNTGSSVGSRSYAGGSDRKVTPQRRGFLQPPGAAVDQSRSASFIAATLAASRSASLSPNVTGQQENCVSKLRRPASSRSPSVRSVNSSRSSDHALDTTSIPPTTSLIEIFEQNEASPNLVKRPPAKKLPSATVTSTKVPKRAESPPTTTEARTPSPLANNARRPPAATDKPKLATIQSGVSEHSEQRKSPPTGRKPSLPTTKPIPMPGKTLGRKIDPQLSGDVSSDDSFVSASDYQPDTTYQPSFRAELAARKSRSHGLYSSPSATSSITAIDSLANAIVASSLASSRAVSPSKPSLYPVPPPPRRSGRSHLFHHGKEDTTSRTPSPAKPPGALLRTTMRKPKSKEEVDEGEKRRGKKNLVKKHPNKHHEGDRKRWRDAITERERKRYEAVWASNKGLFANGEPGSEGRVVNVVARDVWNRSRLHSDVLEEVWELVDRGRRGALEKEEFVVGMWLIDQRLKGRKLPIRVSKSVWQSAGSSAGSGIQVRKVKC